jgi:hypothetical protein
MKAARGNAPSFSAALGRDELLDPHVPGGLDLLPRREAADFLRLLALVAG